MDMFGGSGGGFNHNNLNDYQVYNNVNNGKKSGNGPSGCYDTILQILCYLIIVTPIFIIPLILWILIAPIIDIVEIKRYEKSQKSNAVNNNFENINKQNDDLQEVNNGLQEDDNVVLKDVKRIEYYKSPDYLKRKEIIDKYNSLKSDYFSKYDLLEKSDKQKNMYICERAKGLIEKYFTDNLKDYSDEEIEDLSKRFYQQAFDECIKNCIYELIHNQVEEVFVPKRKEIQKQIEKTLTYCEDLEEAMKDSKDVQKVENAKNLLYKTQMTILDLKLQIEIDEQQRICDLYNYIISSDDIYLFENQTSSKINKDKEEIDKNSNDKKEDNLNNLHFDEINDVIDDNDYNNANYNYHFNYEAEISETNEDYANEISKQSDDTNYINNSNNNNTDDDNNNGDNNDNNGDDVN